MRYWLPTILAGLLHAGVALTATATPVGLWKTIDDHSHKPRALVRISESHGVLSGRIIRLFRAPGQDPAPRCADCRGKRHDQPVLGMKILWGFRRDGGRWQDGRILDPETGKIYRCRLRVSDDGEKLRLRGYIGLPLFGRSQTWLRADSASLMVSP